MIRSFRGAETVRENKTLVENAIFHSSISRFEGELSSSHFTIKSPIAGSETYISQGKSTTIDHRHYWISNAGQAVAGSLNSDTPVEGFCIGFTHDYMTSHYASSRQTIRDALDTPSADSVSKEFFSYHYPVGDDRLGQLLRQIKHHVSHGDTDDMLDFDGLYLEVCSALIASQEVIRDVIEDIDHVHMITREEIYRRTRMMYDYIHDLYLHNISVDDICRHAALSRYHGIRCYKKVYGITPYQQVLQLRMEYARQLILSGHTIAAAAYDASFGDYRAFSKRFKTMYGKTPSQYRRWYNEQ